MKPGKGNELSKALNEESRKQPGYGYKQDGLGSHPGSKVHGKHKNVVHKHSHGQKLRHH